MNLILIEEGDLVREGLARLSGRRARHVREVHRAQIGDELAVGQVGGLVGQGRVVDQSASEIFLEIRLDEPPPPALGIDLLLAMPRPKILRKILEAAASLGVKRIVLVNSYRVEKSYFSSPLIEQSNVREHLLLGLEQARDTILPQVRIERRFKPFVEDELGLLWPEARRLLAHPVAEGEVRPEIFGKANEAAVVAVGPEGGWIPYEVELLEAHGFSRFSLGRRILRVDVAVPYIVAQLDLARRLAP